MSPDEIVFRLHAVGLIADRDAVVRPLAGGVSSDIHLVEAGTRRFVVKAALPKLRVKDDWYADISRNAVEQDYFAYAAPIVPGAMPRILARDPAEGWFAMEYLHEGFAPWKQRLMTGDAQPVHAHRAGDVLGKLHHASWGDPDLRRRFATLGNFRALRIEPYLLTTAERLPQVRDELRAEAERLATTSLALVHGDYSPKNLLVSAERLVVLDAECGWFGDPAFDAAFLLAHLHLKALLPGREPGAVLTLVPEFWAAYTAALGAQAEAELEARIVRLVLCLMLARVHGKSPVEYLTSPAQRECVTTFGLRHLPKPPRRVPDFTGAWRTHCFAG